MKKHYLLTNKWKIQGGKKMTRFLQILQMLLAVIFIILTLGFISVEMEWEDGTRFRYSGWQRKRK